MSKLNIGRAAVARLACNIVSISAAFFIVSAQANVAQSPLLLGGGNVPGNLVLTPSVEFPTVISVANLGEYDIGKVYAGYFDSDKCYDYIREDFTHPNFGDVKGEDGGGYFTPMNTNFKKPTRNCGGELWSGHYLNWATTQTIDPFRKALTGGYRVVDTKSKTILEKATRSGRPSYFSDRVIKNTNVVKAVSPYAETKGGSDFTSSVTSGNTYQKNKTLKVTRVETEWVPPKKWWQNGEWVDKNKAEYFSVRVEVCKKGMLEENCTRYGDNYKPEGLLQEYADDIRYSVFSYLNIDGNGIDGGVLRSPQDYIGAKKREPNKPGTSINAYAEWDPETGVLKDNPRNDNIGNSGVINYINKFGEITNQHKSNDPVSELYYAAIRYLRGKQNISSYSNPAGNDSGRKDYFPVVTDWVDPIQYSCQKNAILGIGDVNTHNDHDLLPDYDSEFLDLQDFTAKIFQLEGIGKTVTSTFNGNGNSAYIAGLAYYANTQDMRPEMAGKQTASTYWVDVRENQVLLERRKNQYLLAAKYGGFEVPANYAFGARLEDAWWNKSGETLITSDKDKKNFFTDKRPDNFYVASDAEAMVKSLREAFAKIASEVQSSTTALSSNSSRLETGSAVFQSKLNNKLWSGDLLALKIDADGVVSDEPSWSIASKLDALSAADITKRNILSVKSSATPQNVIRTGVEFKWDKLSALQQAQLVSKDHVNYLRGDRSQERTLTRPDGKFRERGSRLGDIVNSDPQFVHQQNYGYTRLRGWSNDVANKYKAFRETNAYKARIPMVIVGANDGMLHAFDARIENGGSELFAFVPNSVIPKLKHLAEFDYTHRYYVDGTTRVADAWLGDKWATVAVGVTGAGGSGVFALNVTDVASSSSVGVDNVMWEFTDPKMGYTMGQPTIVALPNEKFGVVISSGYHDSSPDKGYVWVLDVEDGSVIKEFELDTKGNLGAVLAVDLNGNAVANRLYTADTLGNVWRLDLEKATQSSWGIPSGLNSGPLFKVKDAEGNSQAITAPLTAAFNKSGEVMLVFGTGSFYRVGDNEVSNNPPVETLYGLFDSERLIEGRNKLLKQKIIFETNAYGNHLRATSGNELSDEQGWYLDLAWAKADGGDGPKGERVVAQASLRSTRAVFTTMTPVDDPCASGGTSMLMALDLFSGERLPSAYFDVSGDGVIDDADYYVLPNGQKIPWSGISDGSDGVYKGVTDFIGANLLCYAGSTGVVKCIPTAGSIRKGRQSWREVREADE